MKDICRHPGSRPDVGFFNSFSGDARHGIILTGGNHDARIRMQNAEAVPEVGYARQREKEMEVMKIGIVGLGLIGGSFAKAITQNTDHSVYGTDLQLEVIERAKAASAIEDELTPEVLSQCDLVIIALYPKDTIDYLMANGTVFRKGAVVMDCCGVKETVCIHAEPIASEHGFHFLGAHPMAGREYSGFEHSQKSLFRHASMILTPPSGFPKAEEEKLKGLWLSLGFSNIQVSTPADHDRIIAYTSQLAHVVSSAYVKSPVALEHSGFSGGSFKDLTRVARLNEEMWTELFLLNRENLTLEIDGIIGRLEAYRDAISTGDREELWSLLREGTIRKIVLDGQT
jgi:prephenate dehydrogenase